MRGPRIVFAMLLACAGCAHFPDKKIPPVKYADTNDALRIVRERSATVRTLAATGTITLSRPNGESVRLDLAMVSRKPDDLRLRAWKLGRAVFDLTLTRDGAWLLTPTDPSIKIAPAAASRPPPSLRRAGAC
jgi:hypothetical protein